MAKNIWYKIPFQSQLGIDYELRIYKEGTPTSVTTLSAGATPFVTDEDTNNDFFAPVRTQTGSITVIYEPGTQFPTVDVFMAALMPASNIDTPVKLYKIVNSTETLVWQGFLSSELYTQQYISFAQEVTLPVISVLQAMESVQITTAAVSGLMTVLNVIEKAINQMAATCDDYPYTQFTFPAYLCGGNISGKYIDTTILFEQKEYTNENSTTYIVSGLSCLEIMRRVCQYMGWTCREVGQKLYITDPAQLITDSYTRRPIYYADKLLTQWEKDQTSPDVEAEDMDDEFVYRGDGHEMGMAQGAKSVEVVAKVEKYDLDLQLPETPTGDLTHYTATLGTATDSGDHGPNITIDSYVSTNFSFDNRCLFFLRHINSNMEFDGEATVSDVLSSALINPSALYVDPSEINPSVGAFMARIKQGDESYMNGLYIVGVNDSNPFSLLYTPSETNHVFIIQSIFSQRFNNGKLVLKCDMIPVLNGDAWKVWRYNSHSVDVLVCLKFGNLYWNGSSWSTSFAYFRATFDDNNREYNIDINRELKGDVSLRMFPICDNDEIISRDNQCYGRDMFIKELSLSYKKTEDVTLSDRGENKYYRLLGTNFSDEVSVNVDLASSLNNAPSPSLIMEDTDTPMTEINYGTAQSPDMRRPEVELLNRLATYYGLPRRTVTIEAQHPTTAPLPLLRLTGYDSKNYLPIAESRDWQVDKSTLTCMENPFPAS